MSGAMCLSKFNPSVLCSLKRIKVSDMMPILLQCAFSYVLGGSIVRKRSNKK